MNEVNRKVRERRRHRSIETGGGTGEEAERSMSEQVQQFGATVRDANRSCHDEAESEQLLNTRQNVSGQ